MQTLTIIVLVIALVGAVAIIQMQQLWLSTSRKASKFGEDSCERQNVTIRNLREVRDNAFKDISELRAQLADTDEAYADGFTKAGKFNPHESGMFPEPIAVDDNGNRIAFQSETVVSTVNLTGGAFLYDVGTDDKPRTDRRECD